MPVLFAKRWDAKAGRWLPGTPPTLEAGVRKFTHGVMFAKMDHTSSLVTVTIEWNSAAVAATWASQLVELINARLRAQAMRNSERSIDYLNSQLTKNNTVELHQAISQLIEEQVNRAMVASVQRDYAYRIIDPPVPADVRYRPQRILMAVIGAALGFFLSWICVHAYRAHKLRSGNRA
jgi:uncharacterized protein involved in exopolysaccharide biosynthesis